MPQPNSIIWQSLRAPDPNAGLSSTIAPWAAIYADSRIMVMCADPNGNLNVITQKAPNSDWGAWKPFGISISGRPATGGIASRMQIFVVDANQRLQYREQLAPNTDQWGPWTALSNNIAVQGPTVRGRHRDGRLAFFVTGMDGAVYYTTQRQVGSSGYTPLKALTGPGAIQGPPDVASNADGRLEIFGQGLDKKLYHIYQKRADVEEWDVWYPVDNQIMIGGTPVVAANADGRLEVFARGVDNRLMHIYQLAPNGGWSGWSPLLDINGKSLNMQNRPTVVANPDGRLEVFYRTSDNLLGQLCQLISPKPGWSVLSTIGGNTQSVPAVARNADGRLEVFVYADGQLWHTYQVDMQPYYVTDGKVATVMTNNEIFYSTLPEGAGSRRKFYILKNDRNPSCRFEEFEYDNNFMYRLKDTSWAFQNSAGGWVDVRCGENPGGGPPAYYTVMQPPPPGELFSDSQTYWSEHRTREGAPWPRRMFVGQEYRVHNVLVAFNKQTAGVCSVRIDTQPQDQQGWTQYKLASVGPMSYPDSSLRFDDVIQLMTTQGAGGGESFYYARGYGWIAFGQNRVKSVMHVDQERRARVPPCPGTE